MTTDTDTLRAAAALLRQRAGAATSGPWRAYHGPEHADEAIVTYDDDLSIALCGEEHEPQFTDGDAEHIASLHPLVAFSLAPLLEQLAGRADMVTASVKSPQLAAAVVGSHIVGYVEAVRFARAYLGEEEPT